MTLLHQAARKAVEALNHAQQWIGSAPHGDNCYVSDHYEGDPGDRCNCGKESALSSVERGLEALQQQPEPVALVEMTARKDAAYEERNKVVAALATVFPSGIARTAIEGWSEDWHGCVYIDLPTGQASWHFHDSQAHLFAGLPPYTKPWDGHDTPKKYRRLAALQHQEVPSTAVIPPAPPECETEDEKTAFSFGYWQGLHAARKGQEVPREPVAVARPLTSEEEENAWNSITEQGCSCCTAAVRLFCRLNGITLSDAVLATSPSTTRQQEAGSGWRPIESAPKDGSQMLLSNGQIVAQGWWEHQEPYIHEHRDEGDLHLGQDESDGYDGWLDCEGGMLPEPTHWMPLPAAPSTPENADGVGGKTK